jgi:tRNA modification GTPase
MYQLNDNIIALSTPEAVSALAIVRLSGKEVVALTNSIFTKNIQNAPGYTLHYGFLETAKGDTLDEVMVSVFRAPKSFTGEDMVEISCHGSPIVVKLIIKEFIANRSIRLAEPGEFSLRAYLNGKVDLVKAESVADLIHSESEAAHKVAINQLRNGFSNNLSALRQELIDLAALLELELDFGEEDVEFAKRDKLVAICEETNKEITQLIGSFTYGNALKNGIQTAIVGKPNAGKSTLLNALLNDDRAIVSNIAGTTRDTLEERLVVNGVLFNLIDTAGLRDSTDDTIEKIGIERALKAMDKAGLIFYLIDASENIADIQQDVANAFKAGKEMHLVFTKTDKVENETLQTLKSLFNEALFISADNKDIASILGKLNDTASSLNAQSNSNLVTNQRHLVALQEAKNSLDTVLEGLETGLYLEQIAADLKSCLYHLGSISGGTIGADDVLTSVFTRFCIGK